MKTKEKIIEMIKNDAMKKDGKAISDAKTLKIYESLEGFANLAFDDWISTKNKKR